MQSSLSRSLYSCCFVARPPAGSIVFADTVGVFLQRQNGLSEVGQVQVHKWPVPVMRLLASRKRLEQFRW